MFQRAIMKNLIQPNMNILHFNHFHNNNKNFKIKSLGLSFSKSYAKAQDIKVSQYFTKNENEKIIYKKFENRGFDIVKE